MREVVLVLLWRGHDHGRRRWLPRVAVLDGLPQVRAALRSRGCSWSGEVMTHDELRNLGGPMTPCHCRDCKPEAWPLERGAYDDDGYWRPVLEPKYFETAPSTRKDRDGR